MFFLLRCNPWFRKSSHEDYLRSQNKHYYCQSTIKSWLDETEPNLDFLKSKKLLEFKKRLMILEHILTWNSTHTHQLLTQRQSWHHVFLCLCGLCQMFCCGLKKSLGIIIVWSNCHNVTSAQVLPTSCCTKKPCLCFLKALLLFN